MFQFCLPSYTQTLFIKIHDHSLLVANFKSFNYSVFCHIGKIFMWLNKLIHCKNHNDAKLHIYNQLYITFGFNLYASISLCICFSLVWVMICLWSDKLGVQTLEIVSQLALTDIWYFGMKHRWRSMLVCTNVYRQIMFFIWMKCFRMVILYLLPSARWYAYWKCITC